jgi:hypothetical protein
MTQRVSDEQLVRWTRSNDSALNDVSADCQDARAEIATLREHLAKVCEAGKDLRDTAFCDVIVALDCPRGDCDCCTCEAVGKFDAALS